MKQPSKIQKVINVLLELQKDGSNYISISPFLNFLYQLDKEKDNEEPEQKYHHEISLLQFKVNNEHYLEMLKSVFDSSKTALTTTILVNGGASVALLSFIGKVITDERYSHLADWIIKAEISFASGVIAGAFATGTTYLTQYCYSANFTRSAIGFHIATIGLVLLSYLAFILGIINSYHGFLTVS